MKKNAMRTLIILLVIVMTPFPAFAVNDDYIPIQIDGHYDDWEDKPFTEVYPGKNPPQSKINYVSLFRDEDNAYVHVTFAYKNNQDITNMTIDLYTNLGDDSYFLIPGFFWPMEPEFEPDMTLDESPGLSPLEEIPSVEEGTGTEPETSPDDSTETTPDESSETTPDETTETAPDEESNDQGGTTDTSDTTDQNILAGHAVQSYVLVADNEKTDPAADPGTENADNTVTTDEKSNNGQGNGTNDEESTVAGPEADDEITIAPDEQTNNGQGNGAENDNGQGDLLDILDPGNLVDLDNVLDQFTPDGAIDDVIPGNEEDLNSNLDLKKPGWYGTWGFTVWDGLDLVGNGYYTRSEGEPDELELYIPLSSIEDDYEGITEISMRIRKLGPQYIMSTGASTGAIIGVATGAGIALLSVGAYTFKRKRPFALGKGK